MTFVLVALWLLCGVLAASYVNLTEISRYHLVIDKLGDFYFPFIVINVILGPIALAVAVIFYFLWRRDSRLLLPRRIFYGSSTRKAVARLSDLELDVALDSKHGIPTNSKAVDEIKMLRSRPDIIELELVDNLWDGRL